MTPKIVFVDVDGTLFNDKNQISSENINNCIKIQNHNIPVVINTGRYGKNAIAIAKIIKADQHEGYIIGNDGAEIWSFKANKWIFLSQMSLTTVNDIYHWFKKYDNTIALNYSAIGTIYTITNDHNRNWNHFIGELDLEIKMINNISELQEPISKIILVTEKKWPAAKSDHLITIFNATFTNLTIVYLGANVFSIGNKNINKGTALQWLCNHLNIATKNSIGIGDNYNDISMLETVGYPVVMDNAVMTLKTKNYYLTTSNNDSGVAKAIAYYFPLPFQLNN